MTDPYHRRSLVMIDRLDLESDWEQNLAAITGFWDSPEKAARNEAADHTSPEESQYGSFCLVLFEPRPDGWRARSRPVPPPTQTQPLKFPFEQLGLILDDPTMIRMGMETFYTHYVRRGRLDREMERVKRNLAQDADSGGR